MNDNYSKSKELSKEFQNCLKVYADMLGEPNPYAVQKYGFVPGLRMNLDKQALEAQLEKLEQGIFQVLFTGCFSTGKSTLLNALMRKEVLRSSINPETAVITRLIFKKDAKVIVHRKNVIDKSNGKKETREMSVEDFFNEYRVDLDNPSRFNDIDFVDLLQPEEGIGDALVQLVDSPGTESSPEDTAAARKFAEDAHAIVHLINSVTPFIQEDKAYIASHYANRQMRNVFFVCNRFDSLNKKEKEDLRARTREQLHDVFTDKNGVFDEELYNNRVFFTDAFHSLLCRTGHPFIETDYGEIKIDDAATGVPAFEDALSEYLTAGDRDREAFRGYMSQLASKYVRAMDTIEETLAGYRQDVDKLIADRKDFETKNEKLNRIIEQIKNSCRNCVAGMLNSAQSEFDSCMNRIDSEWNGHFSQTDLKVSILDFIKLELNRRDEEKVKELTKPLADEVQNYVRGQYAGMVQSLHISMEAHLKTLEDQINLQQMMLEDLELPFSLEEIGKTILHDPNFDCCFEGSGKQKAGSFFQIILGLIGGDPEIVMDGMNNTKSNGEAIKNFLIKNVLEYLAWYIVPSPVGILMLIWRLITMVKGMDAANRTRAADILIGMRGETVQALRDNRDKYIQELETHMSAITRAGNEMSSSILQRVEDFDSQLENTIRNLQENSNALADETERTDRIREALLENISQANILLNGKPLTDADVRAMAV